MKTEVKTGVKTGAKTGVKTGAKTPVKTQRSIDRALDKIFTETDTLEDIRIVAQCKPEKLARSEMFGGSITDARDFQHFLSNYKNACRNRKID